MPFLIATLVIALLSSAALLVLSAANWVAVPAEAAVPPPAARDAFHSKAKCTACGFVQSVRRIAAAGDSPESYEITVRLRDGSTYVYADASPASWRRGERIVFIAGQRPPGE